MFKCNTIRYIKVCIIDSVLSNIEVISRRYLRITYDSIIKFFQYFSRNDDIKIVMNEHHAI